jgi:hypothetical protein
MFWERALESQRRAGERKKKKKKLEIIFGTKDYTVIFLARTFVQEKAQVQPGKQRGIRK